MDAVYRLGRVTAAEVREAIPDPPSYSAVRAHLRILEEKGHLRHETDGPRYVYFPTVPRVQASPSAMRRVLRTFFGGSVSQAMAALLDVSDDLSPAELDRLQRLIDEARRDED